MPSRLQPTDVSGRVVTYFRAVQRDLPWRRTRDPYAIWVSEIMLQQTRVATVVPYYQQWMARFPTVRALADAPLDQVLSAWSGLGYYSRARNLHRGAQEVVARFGGELPADPASLRQLPGIGPYTAGAISSIAFGLAAPLVDGNVARVLARLYAIDGDIKSSAVNRELWRLAGELVPDDAPGDFNQGLMELGATVCTPARPTCLMCPVRDLCRARAAGREHELPRVPARKRARDLPLIDAGALWIARGGRLLLARRLPSGLYGGLWELPQTEDRSQLEAVVAGARLRDAAPMHEHEQVLTHRRLRIRVYAAELARPDGARDVDLCSGLRSGLRSGPRSGPRPRLGKSARERYDRVAWHGIATVRRRGLSAATQAIIDAMGDAMGEAPGADVPEKKR